MKRTIGIITFFVFFVFALSACSKSTETTEVVLGNTNGNYNNSAMYVEAEGWIFYSDTMKDYTLTKMKPDGSEKTTMNESSVMGLSFADGWLYYAQMQENFDGYLYRMKPDGTEKQQIGTASIDIFANTLVAGDAIYFSNKADGSTLYRMKTDGSALKKLNDLATYKQTFEDQWLYYISVSTDPATGESKNQLRKVRTDGSEDLLLVEPVGSNAIIQDGWVYYTAESGSDLLYRIKPDGMEKTALTDVGVSYINIHEGTLYYQTADQGLIFSSGLDGSAPKQLTESGGTGIQIAGDWIYFMSRSEGGRPYRVKLDGTGLEKAYSVELVLPDPQLEGAGIVRGLGTVNANLNGESKFVVQGDWVYYNTDTFTGPVKKMKLDGGDQESVIEKAAMRLNLVGDWLYFIDGGFYNSLARVKTDGTGYGLILDASCSELIVRDEWMYFINASDQNRLYKVKIDGTDLTLLSEDAARGLNLSGDWLYYSLTGEDFFIKEGIYKVKTDGSSRTKLSDTRFLTMAVEGGWIYFSLEDPNTFEYQLRKMKTDGSEDTLLDNQALATIAGVYEDWLYYFNGMEEEGLIRTRLDGTGKEVLIGPGNFVWVHFLGDKIIFFDNNIGQYRMMNLDGSELVDLGF
ncbi:DUF5050 domain-containing protein [Acidaminobacter sp.]|uniref:DUF5050 domain-containing protein n=1 Tax=Acidaminobacter sp. TaxID=1872102 RepID=UPI00256CCE5F|nr:DUF5050 domain-containing protein [Acidaminobacter sp.]MDK9712420.1 DUF5050 domain-containing protein [Acidaminobacter sp.]